MMSIYLNSETELVTSEQEMIQEQVEEENQVCVADAEEMTNNVVEQAAHQEQALDQVQ